MADKEAYFGSTNSGSKFGLLITGAAVLFALTSAAMAVIYGLKFHWAHIGYALVVVALLMLTFVMWRLHKGYGDEDSMPKFGLSFAVLTLILAAASIQLYIWTTMPVKCEGFYVTDTKKCITVANVKSCFTPGYCLKFSTDSQGICFNCTQKGVFSSPLDFDEW